MQLLPILSLLLTWDPQRVPDPPPRTPAGEARLRPTRIEAGLAGSPAEVAAPVQQAVTDALAVPGGRAIVRGYQVTAPCPANRVETQAASPPEFHRGRSGTPWGFQISEARLERPIDGSGRYAVRLRGPACQGWAWVVVEVRAPVPVTTRRVARGELLDGAVTVQEREVLRSRAPAQITPGARATRALNRGQMIEPPHLAAAGAAIGGSIKVIVRMGPLSVAQSGRIVPCAGGRSCAVLPSGKHVTGELVDGQLVVAGP